MHLHNPSVMVLLTRNAKRLMRRLTGVIVLIMLVDGCMAQDGVTIVNVVPKGLSAETNQDSEPFLSISGDHRTLVVSAFTPDPNNGADAPLFVSSDGGGTWFLNSIVPSAISTEDISHTFAGTRLYAGILALPATPPVTHLKELDSADVIGGGEMHFISGRDGTDQPYIVSSELTNGDVRVLMGINDFSAPIRSKTATLDVLDGSAFRPVRLEGRQTLGQNGPSVRPTIAKDGTAYAAYFGWRSNSGFLITSDVVVVRDDPGEDLTFSP